MIHQKGSRQDIIIFTRYPSPGRTKTRLIPELGADGAARLQRRMTAKIVNTAREMVNGGSMHLGICYTGGTLQQMQAWLGRDIPYYQQQGKDLGERMLRSLQEARQRGALQAVIIGSDCPALDVPLINQALEALHTSHLVLGPSADGGYYLIGASCELQDNTLSFLFSDMPWGTPEVFQTTVNRAKQKRLNLSILKELNDIDFPGDLKHLDHHPDLQ